MEKRKAQTAIEFIILVGVIMLFTAVFMLAIQESTSDKIEERQNNLVKETAYAVQDEINLAFKASEGYSREFKIPEKLGSQDYSASVAEDMLYINTTDGKHAIAVSIPKITGSIVKGSNIIQKQNGEVKINS